MSVTAKEIARKLGLSPAAVSMALNDRPGVSTETRRLVRQTAEAMGYDFTRIEAKAEKKPGSIYFICCQTSSAIFSYAPIFDEILRGAMQECQAARYTMRVQQFYAQDDSFQEQIADLRVSGCRGIILLGTEVTPGIAQAFLALKVPLVVVDSYFDTLDCSCVLINNVQGAYLATEHLIRRRMQQPGYLKSNVPLHNFDERWEGYRKALRANGMHPSKSVVHTLAPTIEGAQLEMQEILDRKDTLAGCYFAENDLIAIGAIKALQSRGYRVPVDIAVAGFDNISEGRVMEPPLTTIQIPRAYMGRLAARQLLASIREPVMHSVKIEVATELVVRKSG